MPVQFKGLGEANELTLRVMGFDITDKTCQIYYSYHKDGKYLFSAYLDMTEQEFEDWGQDNDYIKQLALSKLELEEDFTVRESPKPEGSQL